MKKYVTIAQLLPFQKRKKADVSANMVCWKRNVTFMSHFHKNEDEKKKVLSEVAQDLNKEQYNNDTKLKENSKWQSFGKKPEDACAVTDCNDGIKKAAGWCCRDPLRQNWVPQ